MFPLSAHFLGEFFESSRLSHSEFGEYFAIEDDVLCFFCGDEPSIRKSKFSERIAQSNYPEPSEGTLLVVAIAPCVFSGLDESFFGSDEIRLAAPSKTDGLIQYIFSSFAGGDAAFHSGHSRVN